MPPIEPSSTQLADGVTEDNVNDAMASLLQQGGFGVEGFETPPTDPPVETQPPVVEDETPPATPEVPPEAPTFLTLPDGRVLTIEDAERFAQFEQTVMADPRFIAAYEQVFGEATPPTETAPATPPIDARPPKFQIPEDLADELEVNPVAKMLWERMQQQDSQFEESLAALRADQQRISQLTQSQQEAVDNYQRNNAATLVNQAKMNFQREHNLQPAEMDKVFNATVNMFNLDRVVSLPVNPITGAMETPDPVSRLEGAFDAAYKAIPEFFEREQNARIEAARTEAERKGKLSSLSSSGSSAPPPAPVDNSNPASRRDALIADVAGAMSGNMIQPE